MSLEVSMEIKKYRLNPILGSHENDNVVDNGKTASKDNVLKFTTEDKALNPVIKRAAFRDLEEKKKKARLEQIHRSVLILIRSGQASSSIH